MPPAKLTSDLPADALRSVPREDGFNGTLQLFYNRPTHVRRWFRTKNKGGDTLRRVPNSEASGSRIRSSASLPFHDHLEVKNPLALAA